MLCRFCSKSDHEVRVMITKCTSSDLHICDECVRLCYQTVLEKYRDMAQAELARINFAELWGTDL